MGNEEPSAVLPHDRPSHRARAIQQQAPPPPLPRSKQRAGGSIRRRRRRGAGEPGEGGGAGARVAVLRQLRRLHQVGATAVPVPGRGAPRVPPGLPGLRQVQPQRRPAGVPVHGPRPRLLPAPLHRARRRRRAVTTRSTRRLVSACSSVLSC